MGGVCPPPTDGIIYFINISILNLNFLNLKRGLIAQYLLCAITDYCTQPVLSNKPASRGGLIAQNPLPENIARWRKWVPKMHKFSTDCT